MILSLFTIAVACFCVLLHYVIGSPFGSEYFSGRPLSFYGAFIARKHKIYEENELKRLSDKFNSLIPTTAADKVEELEAKINAQYRPNPYNMFGCCPICFFTWVSIILWAIILVIIGNNLLLLPLLVPVSVVISNRIKL